jgi:putative hemolysin
MMTTTVVLLELLLLLIMVLANALLAGAEIAIVSSRKARLHQRSREGDQASARALALANAPNRFLSTVQIGITTVAVGAGAFGGTHLAELVAPILGVLGLPVQLEAELAVILVVLAVTYVTLVVGELVPKRIALNDPERMAARVSGVMTRLSVLATPFVHILSRSTDLILRLLPLQEQTETEITEEEIRGMIAHATEAGILEATEQQIVERLFRLSDMSVDMIMTPREKIVWLDEESDRESLRERLGEVLYTRYPVVRGGIDDCVGYVKVQDLLELLLAPETGNLGSILRKPHFLPPWTPVFRLLELFQWSHVHMALVTDDEGTVKGIVTLYDVLEGIVGDLPETREAAQPGVSQRQDGSWLMDGLLPFEEFLDRCHRQEEEDPRAFPTLHAFLVYQLEDAPEVAAVAEWKGLRLEIVDMDGTRVDKVLVKALKEA